MHGADMAWTETDISRVTAAAEIRLIRSMERKTRREKEIKNLMNVLWHAT
jgi:hypothetical protein